jgi:nicotinamidase-related amidase
MASDGPLLVVDIQQGFLNEFTEHLPARVARLIDSGRYEPLLFTRFINPPGSAYRRLLNWHACAGPPDTSLAPELAGYSEQGSVFDKHGLAGLPPELRDHFRQLDAGSTPTRVHVVGIDTDMCVLKCAMDLFDLGLEPIVWADCCASTAGLQAHLAGLAILGRNIGPHQLRLTGLNDGYLARP